MPLIKRGIEPVNLSRTHVAPGVQNELECVTNNTLANVIRQLSSLSKHAEDMFSELYRETNSFFHRANQLQERVDRLKVKVTQLDSTVEEVSLQDINMRKPFKSSVLKDQQIVTLATRPAAIEETYRQCDAPPALDKLNPYREDGKDSMKFYTDPQYFFELWCMEMQKDTELTKKELRKRKGKRGPHKKQPTEIREIRSKNAEMQKHRLGPEFVPEPERQMAQGHHRRPNQENNRYERSPSRPSSLEIQNMDHMAQHGHHNNSGYPGQGPHGQYNNYQHANGPVMRQHSGEEGYPGQAPPPYTQNQQPPPYTAQAYNQAGPRAAQEASPHQTPTKRGSSTPSSRGGSVVSSPRPVQAPPPPPGVDPMGSKSSSASRESLPPPPPPPPLDEPGMHGGGPAYSSPQTTPHMAHMNSVRDSPARQTPSPAFTKSSTPESIDLPPPPPPPPVDTPGSIDSMPPPPPTPPPPEPLDSNGGPPPGAPPPPPPPPPSVSATNNSIPKKAVPNGVINDSTSQASNGSSNTSGSGADNGPVRDNRSDLLNAIRTGFQLRRVEERRQKAEDKRPSGRLDVQSIMEAAFEMRRKALEANDSDEEESDEGDGAWDSDEN